MGKSQSKEKQESSPEQTLERRRSISDEEIYSLLHETHFSISQLYELQQLFEKMDKDGNGQISKKGFKNLIKQYKEEHADQQLLQNITQEDVATFFNQLDRDKNKEISFKELVTLLSVLCKGTQEERLGFIFDLHDKNQCGKLGASELQEIIESISRSLLNLKKGKKGDKDVEQWVSSMIKHLDTNKDNIVTKEEWIKEVSKEPVLISALFKQHHISEDNKSTQNNS